MIWKLFVSVLAVSDVGSVSTSAIVTDYLGPNARALCEQAAVNYGQGREVTVQNHRITIKLSASCSPGSTPVPEQVYQDGVPPPVVGMLRGFLDGMERR